MAWGWNPVTNFVDSDLTCGHFFIFVVGTCGRFCVVTCMAAAQRYTVSTHCNGLQRTATHCNTLQHTATHCSTLQHTAAHNTLQHTAATCGQFSSKLWLWRMCARWRILVTDLAPWKIKFRPFRLYVAVCCSVLQCVAVCCSVLQCVALCCSVYTGDRLGAVED